MAESVTVIDAETMTAIGRVSVGPAPCAMGISTKSGHAYVVNSLSDSMTRIELTTGEAIDEVAVGRAPVGLACSRGGDRVYVGNRGAGTISVIGAGDGVEWGQIPVGEAPAGCVVDPVTGWIVVSNAGSGSITVVEDLSTGPPPQRAALFEHPLVGRRLPVFSLPELESGLPRDSREWAGRLYILNFFASW
jgi:YVTN family beta-propeller protein